MNATIRFRIGLHSQSMGKMNIIQRWHIISMVLGMIAGGVYLIARKHPSEVERYYSRSFYPYIVDILSYPRRLISTPLSASEIFLGILTAVILLWFFYGLLRLAVHKPSLLTFLFKPAVHLTSAACIAFIFYLTVWGMNYLRQPFTSFLGTQSPDSLTEADYTNFGRDVVAMVVRSHEVEHRMNDLREFKKLDGEVCSSVQNVISAVIPSRLPVCSETKFLLSNDLMNIFGISGIFLPIFGEPHINYDMLFWEWPYTMAHEKAHAMGFASETDASLIGYMACLSSENALLRYSGALEVLMLLGQYIPAEVWQREIAAKLPLEARQDMIRRNTRIRDNHRKHSRTVAMGRILNDQYLKFNAQELGVRSYGAALPYLVSWFMNNRNQPPLRFHP